MARGHKNAGRPFDAAVTLQSAISRWNRLRVMLQGAAFGLALHRMNT
jgi:hypothetical protein